MQTRIQQVKIEPWNLSPQVQLIRQQLATTLTIFLQNAALDAGKAARTMAEHVLKTEEDGSNRDRVADAAFDAIEWGTLYAIVEKLLRATAEDGVKSALMQLEIEESDIQEVANTIASDYAKQRAAEMIGKMLDENSDLVNNPNAQWVISETTRDDLRDIIAEAFNNRDSAEKIADKVQTASTFNAQRAELIAKTEIAAASISSTTDVWRLTGMVRAVNIVLSSLHTDYDECDEAVAGNPYPIGQLPRFPLHPLCRCGLVAVDIVEY